MQLPIYEITAGLCGIIFFVTALIVQRNPPKKINSTYGYRTWKSMKNQENWDIAQAAGMQHMRYAGLFMLVSAIVVFGLRNLFNFDFLTSIIKGWHFTVNGAEWIETGIAMAVVFASCFYIFYKTEKELS